MSVAPVTADVVAPFARILHDEEDVKDDGGLSAAGGPADEQQQHNGGGLYAKIPEVSKSWDQRETLRPPLYLGHMARIAKGHDIGDARVDALPTSALSHHGGRPKTIDMDPHPEWVDWESVRRGQKAFHRLVGPAYVALAGALLQGFSIGRFAEVLLHNGYAQNAKSAFERYRETGFAIVDWMSYPIDEKNSRAQLQLQNVRAMHSFARRRSNKLFDPEKGEGVALSQFDLAEVLIGFAGAAPDIMMRELGIKLDDETRRDMCQAWRLIGYHLGILDEFNPCTSLEELDAIMDEWMPYTPLRFRTCRPATYELQRSAMEGFGRYSGLGVELFAGALHASLETRDWGIDLDYLQRPCLPGVKAVVKRYLPLMGNPIVSYLLGVIIVRVRNLHIHYPEYVKRCMPFVVVLSRFSDAIIWPIVDKTACVLTKCGWMVLVFTICTLGMVSIALGCASVLFAVIRAFSYPFRALKRVACDEQHS